MRSKALGRTRVQTCVCARITVKRSRPLPDLRFSIPAGQRPNGGKTSNLVNLSLSLFTQYILYMHQYMYICIHIGLVWEEKLLVLQPGALTPRMKHLLQRQILWCRFNSFAVVASSLPIALSCCCLADPSASATLYRPVWLHFDPRTLPALRIRAAHIKSSPRPSYLPLICLFLNG